MKNLDNYRNYIKLREKIDVFSLNTSISLNTCINMINVTLLQKSCIIIIINNNQTRLEL